jgi:hypothetical protein
MTLGTVERTMGDIKLWFRLPTADCDLENSSVAVIVLETVPNWIRLHIFQLCS